MMPQKISHTLNKILPSVVQVGSNALGETRWVVILSENV